MQAENVIQQNIIKIWPSKSHWRRSSIVHLSQFMHLEPSFARKASNENLTIVVNLNVMKYNKEYFIIFFNSVQYFPLVAIQGQVYLTTGYVKQS